jgi:hypothetical protein
VERGSDVIVHRASADLYEEGHVASLNSARGRRLSISSDTSSEILRPGAKRLSQKKSTQVRGIHHETVKWILRDDSNVRMANLKGVPHTFDSYQRAARV